METKSRLRGPNFTSSDDLLLCDIINKYKNIIENKKTDGANLQQKQKAWVEVVNEFNSITTGYSRTVETLQQHYKNLKKKAKKTASDSKMDIPVDRTVLIENIQEYGTSSEGWEKISMSTGVSKENCQNSFNMLSKEAYIKDKYLKKNIMGTGGGPPPKGDDDPLLDKVKALVGPSIEGMYTIYDGDSDLMALQNVPPIENKINEVIKIDADERPSQETVETFFTNNRANLKKKPHDLLTRKRKLESEVPLKQSVSTKFCNLATEKLQLVAMQKEVLQYQLKEAKETLEHNRLLRAMEIEDAKKKYEHNELIRIREREKHK